MRPLEEVPAKPFWTVTVKLPSPKVAVPLTCVELLLESELLAIMHLAETGQPGPVTTTMAEPGSKPVPRTVKLNGLPLRGAAGDVKILATVGTPKATFNGKELDERSEFLRVTAYLPPGSLMEPSTCAGLLERLMFETMHVAGQPAPVKTARTVDGSKFDPLIRKVNVCPSLGTDGVAVIE